MNVLLKEYGLFFPESSHKAIINLIYITTGWRVIWNLIHCFIWLVIFTHKYTHVPSLWHSTWSNIHISIYFIFYSISPPSLKLSCILIVFKKYSSNQPKVKLKKWKLLHSHL
jgi:hypothetical protein